MKAKDLVLCAMFTVIIAICSWVYIPAAVPFTLQTFGVCCAVNLLGGKRSTLSVLIYILLGAIGTPVFAGFSGGIGIIIGPTGGYIIGFIFMVLTHWGITKIFGTKTLVLLIASLIGLLVCYVFGTIWFMAIYAKTSGAIGVATALGWCVVPFVIPDVIKIVLAVSVKNRVSKYVNI